LVQQQTQCAAVKNQFSVFSFQFSVFSFQFSVFSFQNPEISARPIRIRAIRLIRGSPSSHF